MLDALARWFTTAGRLQPEALRLRPNLADVGWPPGAPPLGDPQEALGEAMALAAYNGRLEAMAFLLEQPHGSTPLGWAEHNAKGSAVHEYLASLAA